MIFEYLLFITAIIATIFIGSIVVASIMAILGIKFNFQWPIFAIFGALLALALIVVKLMMPVTYY